MSNSPELASCSAYGSSPSPLYTKRSAEARSRTFTGLGSQSCRSAPGGANDSTRATSPATFLANS